MEHLVFFSYVFTIPIIITIAVVLIMSSKNSNRICQRTGNHYFFLGAVLVMTTCDMIGYYEYLLNYPSQQQLLYYVTDVACASAMFFWIAIIDGMFKNKTTSIIKRIMGSLIIAYITSYISLILANAGWGVLFGIEMIMTMLMIISSLICVASAIKENKDTISTAEVIFVVAITLLIAMDFGSYAAPSVGNLWTMGYYVTLWLIICIIMLILTIYQLKLSEKTISVISEHYNMEKSFESIQEKYALTARELDIVREINSGLGNGQIAEKLIISEGTVKFHVHNILTKMNLSSRVAIISEIQNEMRREKF